MSGRHAPRRGGLFGLMLRLFPRDMRREYGADMEQLFGEQLDETRGSRGARAGYLLRVVSDALVSGGYERLGALATLPQDLRYAARSLRRAPGFTLAVTLTLALGIGASTAIFSIVDGVLLRPLPYPEFERLVQVQAFWEGGERSDNLSYPDFFDLRAAGSAFDPLVALYGFPFTITGEGEPERVEAMMVSPGFAALIGVTPEHGRWFSAGEHRAGGERVVVLSHGLWQRRYGGDAGIVGNTVELSGERFTVVGIGPASMPAGLPALPPAALWMPLGYEGRALDELPGRGNHRFVVVGRLADDTSPEVANQQLAAISARMAEQYPDDNTGKSHHAMSLRAHATRQVSESLWMTFAAVGALLLIAVANVSGLLLSRAGDRAGDTALRAAIGASRGRIVSQLVGESVLLAGMGGALGLGLAAWATHLFLSLGTDIPLRAGVAIDGRIVAFTLALVGLAAVVCGTVPALLAARGGPGAALNRIGVRAHTAGNRLRSLLVAGEVALTTVLLIGAALLLQSYLLLHRVDPGVAADVLTFRLVPPSASYDEARTNLLRAELLERIRAVRGVRAAATVSLLPMSGLSTCGGLQALDQPPFPHGRDVCAEARIITPDYFQVMDIALLRGRPFDNRDRDGSERVVIVNQAVADLLWPDQDPLGHRLTTGWGIPRTVVGVIAAVKQFHLYEEAVLQTYLPAAQQERQGFNVVVRAGDPLALPESMRQAVWSIDPDLAITGMGLVGEYIAGRDAAFAFRSALVGGFAVVALVIAVVGLYASIAYGVIQRRREMALRLAVGARQAQVLGLVLGDGMRTVALGLALGVALGLPGARLLAAFLFDIAPYDPMTFIAVAALILSVGLLANYLPARRAAAVDPNIALHEG